MIYKGVKRFICLKTCWIISIKYNNIHILSNVLCKSWYNSGVYTQLNLFMESSKEGTWYYPSVRQVGWWYQYAFLILTRITYFQPKWKIPGIAIQLATLWLVLLTSSQHLWEIKRGKVQINVLYFKWKLCLTIVVL